MSKITKEKFKTMHNVFDDFTNRNIYKLIRQGFFIGLIGIVSIGKEANVFSARKADGDKVIVKIHRLETRDFNRLYDYLRYDPRYMNIRKRKRELIFAWAQREFRNLLKAREAGVKIPKPIGCKYNIVLEEFIGNSEAAPKLKDKIPKKPKEFFTKVVANMRKMYKAKLIHTDLSAFNILNHNEIPVLIDFSQCTTTENVNAKEYLERDIKNVCHFFKKLEVKADETAVYKKIIQKP